jgi:GDSL-like Lipase/Acylhydrolase family
MVDTKISALTAASAALGADEIAINEAGTSKKLTVDQILGLVERTIQVTQSLNEGGSSTFGGWPDLNTRSLMMLPVSTTQWRVLIRNYSPVSEAGGSGTVQLNSIWAGVPSFSGARWVGVFASTPTQVYTGPASILAASDWVSPWITAPNFVAGQLMALSFGFTGSGLVCYSGPGVNGLLNNVTGASAAAGSTAFASANQMTTCDVRIEYQAVIPTLMPTLVVIGDSIAEGENGGDNGAYPHESWPGQVGQRLGIPVINMGVGSSTAASWAASTAGFKWTRCNLATLAASTNVVAIIALGANDLNGSASAATVEGYLSTIVGYLRTLGINEIYFGTVIPNAFTAAQEVQRVLLNNYLRGVPFGAAGTFDFDKVLALPPVVVTTTSTLATGTNPITVASGTGIVVGQYVTTLPGSTGQTAAATTAPVQVTVVSGTSITLSSNPTTSGAATLMFSNSNPRSDPDLCPNYPHPLRSGYQRMASVVNL